MTSGRTMARLHQASVSCLRQLCNDPSDTIFIENIGVTRKCVPTPIWSDSIVFNKYHRRVVEALPLALV